MTKREKAALRRLRQYIVMERASLTPPPRAAERGYRDTFGKRTGEPNVRPLAEPGWAERNPDLVDIGDEWTNDVAESLRIYFGSWALPIIDALLGEGDPLSDASYLADITGRPLNMSEWSAAAKLSKALKASR